MNLTHALRKRLVNDIEAMCFDACIPQTVINEAMRPIKKALSVGGIHCHATGIDSYPPIEYPAEVDDV